MFSITKLEIIDFVANVIRPVKRPDCVQSRSANVSPDFVTNQFVEGDIVQTRNEYVQFFSGYIVLAEYSVRFEYKHRSKLKSFNTSETWCWLLPFGPNVIDGYVPHSTIAWEPHIQNKRSHNDNKRSHNDNFWKIRFDHYHTYIETRGGYTPPIRHVLSSKLMLIDR